MRPSSFALVLALVALAAGCVLAPPVYWGREIRGRVVDADTGEPIEGAVVVADWKLYSGGWGHGGHGDSLRKEETLTDADGRFAFPSWGPTMRPSYTILDDAPRILVFRRTYEIASLRNAEDSNGFVRRSDWDGVTLRLHKFTGSVAMRAQALGAFVPVRMPLLLREILAEQPTRHDWPENNDAFFTARQALKEIAP